MVLTYNGKKVSNKIILIPSVIILMIILAFSSIYIVKDGSRGIISTFGEYDDVEKEAGIHFKIPFVQHVEYVNIKTFERKESLIVPSSEGLMVTLEVSVIGNVLSDRGSEMIQNINGNVVDTLLIPNLRSILREIVSNYETKSLYSETGRGEISARVLPLLQEKVSQYMNVDQMLLRDVGLPESVKEAIELKINYEQQSQAKQFELISAEKDAEIEIARAKGIAKANEIISNSISEKYIQYRFVEGLNDGNTEVIYVPTEANLPILEATRKSNLVVETPTS